MRTASDEEVGEVMDSSFPGVEFPLCASAQQARGEPRRYLESRLNEAGAGSFSAAAVGANGALMFRRQVRGRYANYHTPCLPLAPPNTRTPFDPVSVGQLPNVVSQLTYFQWNYKDVYIPPHLLHGLLTESNAMERQNAEYDPLLGSAVACLPVPSSPSPSSSSLSACLFFASGPLLQTLTCGILCESPSPPGLALHQCDAYLMPGRIREVHATRTQGKEFVCARSSYHVAFFMGPSVGTLSSVLQDVSAGSGSKVTAQLLTLLATFRTDYCISSVSLSPYIAGEGMVVLETGGIYLWTQGQPLQALQRPLATPTPNSPAHFWQCCYGSHPRSLVLAEHSGVSLGDFRSSCLSFSPLLTSPSEWLPDNALASCLSPPPPSHPHQLHLGTSHSLLLLDTRQPGWPLLQESHDLSHAPQIIGTAAMSDRHSVVMLCNTLSHESVVLGHHRAGPAHPPYSCCAAHVVANYSDLEDQWQGKSALPLLGDRLQQRLAGACLLSLGRQREGEGEGEGEGEDTVAAITMSVLGDLFYQLWSYCETPPTATPTSSGDDWLQVAWLQEQELQVTREEWHADTLPVNFEPMLKYLESGSFSELCPACLAMKSTHFPSSILTSLPHTVTPSQPRDSNCSPLQRRCVFCRARLAPFHTQRVEQRLVGAGLMDETMATGSIATTSNTCTDNVAMTTDTMATGRGLERLRTNCDLRDPGVDGNHDDRVFWEGWRSGEEGGGGVQVKTEPEENPATPTRSQSSAQRKPHIPSSLARHRGKRMGF